MVVVKLDKEDNDALEEMLSYSSAVTRSYSIQSNAW